MNDITDVKNRFQKVLEEGNVKLQSVVSDVFGVAGRKVMNAIIIGEKDPSELAKLVDTNVKAKKEVILKSLENRLTETNVFLLRQLYSQLLYLEQLHLELENEISEKMKPYETQIKQLDEIPGIDIKTAQIIIAEATPEMSTFKDAKSFAAWAGVAPGNNESAGKKKGPNLEKEIPL
jgi:transposase